MKADLHLFIPPGVRLQAEHQSEVLQVFETDFLTRRGSDIVLESSAKIFAGAIEADQSFGYRAPSERCGHFMLKDFDEERARKLAFCYYIESNSAQLFRKNSLISLALPVTRRVAHGLSADALNETFSWIETQGWRAHRRYGLAAVGAYRRWRRESHTELEVLGYRDLKGLVRNLAEALVSGPFQENPEDLENAKNLFLARFADARDEED